MKAFLDGNPVKYPNETLNNPNLILRKQDETGDKAYSLTGNLVFEGSDYDYIYAILKDSSTALENKVILDLENDCCVPAKKYSFAITYKTLRWCEGSCELQAGSIENTPAQDQLTCLKNTLIWDDYAGFKSKQHPRFAYCNELRPNWMHDVLLILSVATATSILVFIPVIASIVLVFNTINSILSWMNSNLSTSFNLLTLGGSTQISLNDLQGYFNLLISFIVGCGRKHPSPLVRDYADNVCGKCGLTFQSSIFKNPGSDYHNTCYVNAPINKGTLETDTTTYWIDENKPIRSGFQFFDEIKGIVNGEWQIVGNVLILERKDFFVPKTPFIDLTDKTKYPSDKIKVCWKHSTKARYSYGTFEYQKDAVNWVGGEASSRYNDMVEWNNPYSANQKGEYKPSNPFTPCRFRDDGIDRDVLSAYKNFPTIGPMIKKYDNVIIMNSHTCYQPMLLIWDPGTPLDNAKVDPTKYYFPGYPGVALNQFYNYPFWFAEGYPGNLYTNFFYIENPKLSGYQGFEFEATVQYDCDLLDALDLDGQVLTVEGLGKVNQISINFKENSLTISGTV